MINPILINANNSVSSFGGAVKTSTDKRTAPTSNSLDLLSPNAVYFQNDVSLNKSIAQAYDFFNRKGRITKKDYDYLKQNRPDIIQEAKYYTEETLMETGLKTTPKQAAKTILLLEALKNKNNKIISIGTSPSFITEALSALGADVTFVPISNANFCTSHNKIKDYFEYYPNFKLVGDYMKEKGITPDNVKDKNVILLDFSSSGRTLHMVTRLVHEYCDIPYKQITSQDIVSLIEDANKEYKAKNPNGTLAIDIDQIKRDILDQKVENASNIPHFSIYSDLYNKKRNGSVASKLKSNKVLFKKFDEFSRPEARAYQICVLDELEKLKGQI